MEALVVPVIASATYAVIEIIKQASGNNEKLARFYPLIALVFGALAGLVAFYFIPNIIVADNVVLAIIIGGASGLSATGINQAIKQLVGKDK